MSAVLVAWLDAVRAGRAAPDDLAEAVRGDDAWHLVTGLPEREALELLDLPAALTGTISLALPVPGDPVGLGGPPSFNHAAMEAGEAVVAGGVGLVPATDASPSSGGLTPPIRSLGRRAGDGVGAPGRACRGHPPPGRPRGGQLAARNPRPAAQPAPSGAAPAPPGYDARRAETMERAVLCLDILELARAGEGGSVSAYEMERRRESLGDLGRAARRALVGACFSPEPSRTD